MNNFMLLLGPSGAGKSTIIRHLLALDNRFSYVTPFTTRPLREGEIDKISVSYSELIKMRERGELVAFNELYGVCYGTSKKLIEKIFQNGQFPVLDFPLEKLGVMRQYFADKIKTFYVSPPSLDILKKRLSDGRDPNDIRFSYAEKEVNEVENGVHDKEIDYKLVNPDGEALKVAKDIYKLFIPSETS